jgi:GLPGLI family protein
MFTNLNVYMDYVDLNNEKLQLHSVQLSGNVSYTITVSKLEIKQYKAELKFNHNASLFSYWQSTDSTIENKDDSSIKENRNGTFQANVKVDLTDRGIIEYWNNLEFDFLLINRKNPNSADRISVKKNKEKLNWKLQTEEKMAGNILCKSAKIYIEEDEYIAWYAESIPVSFGPLYFRGLPGLILEVHNLDKSLMLTANEVNINKDRLVKLKFPNDSIISNDSYEKLKKIKLEKTAAEIKEKLRKMKSRMDH